MVAVKQHANLLAHLRDTAPKRNAALADIRIADGFVLGAQNPGQQRDDAEQRHRDKQLAFHAESPNVAPTERAACTISLAGSTYFIFSSASSNETDSILPDFKHTMRPNCCLATR